MAKMRSPNYPSISLPDAVSEIRKIWDAEKRTAVPIAVLGEAMGYSSLSGPVRTKVAALRKYGLLDQNGGQFKLSDLALHILHSEEGSDEKKQALYTAALRPDLFRELSQTHPDSSDNALKSHLVLRLKFSDAGARQFIKAFRETMSIADGTNQSYSGAKDVEASEDMVRTSVDDVKPGIVPVGLIPAEGGGFKVRVGSGHSTFIWPLSKGVTAHVTFSGGDVKPSHLEMLAKYLEIAKGALEAEEEGQ